RRCDVACFPCELPHACSPYRAPATLWSDFRRRRRDVDHPAPFWPARERCPPPVDGTALIRTLARRDAAPPPGAGPAPNVGGASEPEAEPSVERGNGRLPDDRRVPHDAPFDLDSGITDAAVELFGVGDIGKHPAQIGLDITRDARIDRRADGEKLRRHLSAVVVTVECPARSKTSGELTGAIEEIGEEICVTALPLDGPQLV